MLRRVILSFAMLTLLNSATVCFAFQFGLEENPEIGRLIVTLPNSIDPLKPLFADKDPALRKQLAFALINEEKHPLCALLTYLDAEAHGATTSFYFVSHLGPVGVKRLSVILFEWIRSDDPNRRSKGWQFLHACRPLPTELIPPLTEFLVDKSDTSRSYACRLLGQMGDAAKDSAPQIEKLVTDSSAEIRGFAINALGNMNAVDSLPAVREGLSDADVRVRLAATIAMFQLTQGAVKDVHLLKELHRDGTPEIRSIILDHLHECGEQGIVFIENWKDQIRSASELTSLSKKFESLGPASVDMLMDLLSQKESEETRRSALVLLKWTKHKKLSVRPAVKSLALGDNRRLQLAALDTLPTLGKIPFDDVADLLNASTGVQVAVARCLIHCPPEDQPRALDALRTLMGSDNVEVQIAACHSLLTLKSDQEQALKCLTLMLHPSQEIGTDALERTIQLLEDAGPAAKMAIPLLIKSFAYKQLEHFRDDQHPSVEALIAIGKPAIPRLLSALQHDLQTVQTKAAICFERIDNEQSSHPLAERIWDQALHPEIYGIRFPQIPPESLEQLRKETSSLPVRLTKLLPFHRHDTKALQALNNLGNSAQEAIPQLNAHYDQLTETLAENHLNPSSRIYTVTLAKCQRTAAAIYRIDPSQQEPVRTELNRAFASYTGERPASMIPADLIDIAVELKFRNEQAFEKLGELVDNDTFIRPYTRAIAAYTLALVDSKTPRWAKRLDEMAEQSSRRNGNSYSIDLATRLKERSR